MRSSLEQNWVSYPGDWQPFFERWVEEYPERCKLAETRQLGEHRLLALTICRGGPPHQFEHRLLVAVPHAHEPAGTAASVDLASELLRGRHLNGEPSDLARDEVLTNLLLTVIPDGNPQGRARSPEPVWDGKRDNEEFLKIAFGVAHDGERFGRYPEWRFSEHNPLQVGIEYEQLSSDIWGEPNTNRACTHCRMMDRLYARYQYTHYLSMHQHEYDEAVILPATYDDLSASQQQEIATWADAVLDGWRRVGAEPRAEPQRPYPGQVREQYFRQFWAGRCPEMLKLTVEVQNNRHTETGKALPAVEQHRRARAALIATVEHLLNGV